MDLTRLRPLRHRLIVRLEYLVPRTDYFPGIKKLPPYYHPTEVPQFVRKRLFAFLEGLHTVPPRYLQNIIPPHLVHEARKVYRQMRDDGADWGDAILSMGLITRMSRYDGVNLPGVEIGEILAAGCSCEGQKGDYVLVQICSGDTVLDTPQERVNRITCEEALASVPEEEARINTRALVDTEDRKRLAFLRARSA